MGLDQLPWKDFITLGAALLGAGLGIMNTWNTINARRVRLRVRPADAISVPQGNRMFSIEVVNLSTFPVTITEVGLTDGPKNIDKGARFVIGNPILIDGKPWPRRLEVRESVSAYFDPRQLAGQGISIGRAFARTSCGEVAYGTSPALEQLRTELRA
ncbi:hypothetical protein [Methylobacterium indicum]|uniref:hypothetical protein n=1 Tax=Methylobacterium indicum TaxID=1775910 RepID=UPI000A57D0C0|nr:hypothetical protein [Methylobacterium indicum]